MEMLIPIAFFFQLKYHLEFQLETYNSQDILSNQFLKAGLLCKSRLFL